MHTWAVERDNVAAIIDQACDSVASAMRSRDTMSCVFGARLLSSLLSKLDIENAPVGVLLKVYEPAMSGGGGRRFVVIGDHKLDPADTPTEVQSDWTGFPGHVVVLARGGEEAYLLDPTVSQVDRMWVRALLSPPLASLVLPLGRSPRLDLVEEVQRTVEGWTYVYEPAPDVDWRGEPEWTEWDRFRLWDVVRKEFVRRTGVTLPKPARRNDPCDCGSGLKAKHCCGADARG
jgi:hypothetical protein